MNKFLAGTALAVVAFTATPAAAQAVSGVRVEVLGGFDIARQKIDGIASPFVKLDDTGILYGVGAGFDFPITNGVSLGLDAELTNSTAVIEKNFLAEVFLDDNDTATGNDDTFGDIRYRARPRLDAYVGGRLSFAVSDTSNFYLKGGYTRLKFRNDVALTDHDTGLALNFSDFDPDDIDPAGFVLNDFNNGRSTVGGYRIGAGAQVAFMGNAYFGAEVRYSNYSHDISRFQGALSLGYRFGGRPVEEVYVAPAPAPVPEPLPEPAPATQTCADGSVILATDACPAPPMPAPAPERG